MLQHFRAREMLKRKKDKQRSKPSAKTNNAKSKDALLEPRGQRIWSYRSLEMRSGSSLLIVEKLSIL